MKAILNYAEYTPNIEERSYMGSIHWIAKAPTKGIVKFVCLKDGHTINLEMEGVGVPYLHSNSEYEIEIKITELPKVISKEYVIK